MTVNRLSPELLREFEAIASHSGCELLQATFVGGRLRLVLDRPEGVNLSHCETISKHVSAFLDVVDYGPETYVLEVSSPGLDREFYSPEDYSRFSGRLVRVTWQDAEMANKKTIVGTLETFKPSSPESKPSGSGDAGNGKQPGIVTVIDSHSEERIEIALPDIKMTRLEIDQ